MSKWNSVETTEWVAGNLKKVDRVLGVEVISDQVLRVFRERFQPFLAGIVSAKCVEVATVRPLVSGTSVEFIANVPKESYWTGGALELARSRDIATGSYADLIRVTGVQDVRAFQSKEVEFVERGLRQHDRIASFERVHDRLYRVSRAGLPDLIVVMLNEYELTADHIRTARDRYGKFSVVVITNPNGSATSSANSVASSMDVEIFDWAGFFGRLNKK